VSGGRPNRSGTPAPGTLWLASGSPRRRRMLAEAGIEATVRPAAVDDGRLEPGGVPPRWWVAALAWFKAAAVARDLTAEDPAARGLVLAADTVCLLQGRITGQPADAAAAAETIRRVADTEHEVLTGVALLEVPGGRRRLLVDAARVRCGPLDPEEIRTYVATDAWRGKAGGYNLEERLAAGWPLSCEGDPATVVGLPMRRLEAILAPWRRPAP
jgi:septum formation protein